jgi:thioredoxin-related protein
MSMTPNSSTNSSLRIIAAALATGLLLFLTVSCSNNPAGPSGNYETLNNWVSTSVLYDTTIEKKDYSLLFIMTDWCPHCTNLKQTTLVDPTIVEMLAASFNIAKIVGDADTEVAYRDTMMASKDLAHQVYGEDGSIGYPTVIVMNRQGDELDRIVGYRDPDEFAAELAAYLPD